MIAVVVALLAVAAVVQDTPAPAQDSPSTHKSLPVNDAVLDKWREWLAIDRAQDVVEEFKHARESARDQSSTDGRAVALVARAILLTEMNGAAAAATLLDAAKPTPETAAYVELERVHIAIETDELDRALSLALEKPDANEPRWPTLPHAWFEVGRAFVRKGELTRGAPFLWRFTELAPHDRETPAAFHMLAREALDRGDGNTARQCFERAEKIARWHSYWRARMQQIRESPNEPLPQLGLAQLWLQIDDVERARAVLQKLLSGNPKFAPGWFLLGECDRKRGDLKLAETSYARTIELEPDHLLARHNRAVIALNDKRLEAARDDFTAIVDGPRSAEPLALDDHLQLARVLDQLGENDAATRRYGRYVELGGKEPRRRQ